ncbi:MAG: hypothetical protein QOF89_5560 [Acidobacteriota bacterium]|nr:hypothetical protein [Acidobacteriota bacterium]
MVLSGGGARGAYEIGVLKALFKGAASTTKDLSITPRVFTGTSVGAYNAAFLAQFENPGAAAVDHLETIWRSRIASTLGSCGNGVYRLRADPSRFLDPGCLLNPLQIFSNLGRDAFWWSGYAAAYAQQFLTSDGPLRVRVLESFNLAALFSREPLEFLLSETIDLSRLRTSPNALAVVVSDWRNGVAKVFRKADVTDRLGTDAILASAAIPGIFAPVDLEGTSYVDGGLLMNTPLKPAIDEGADVLHVIYVDPETNHIPFPELPNTLDTFYRIYTILLATQINHDARFTATINEELAALVSAHATALGRELPAVRAKRAVKLGRAASEGIQGEKLYRPVVIHRYRPKTDLLGAEAFLDFRLSVIETFIQQGYEDAVNHDCDREGCVLPPSVPPDAPAWRSA